MSDELTKLRESIKRQATVIKKHAAMSAFEGEPTPEKMRTETEPPVQTEEPRQSVSPEPGS